MNDGALDQLGRGPGTYCLILNSSLAEEFQVGALGLLTCQPGYYLYIGSAHGPGGLQARLGHHSRISPNPHWHVDYLRRHTQLIEIWYCQDPIRREHLWSEQLLGLEGATLPWHGFGASDCSCTSHLAYFKQLPGLGQFARGLLQKTKNHHPVYRLQPAQSSK